MRSPFDGAQLPAPLALTDSEFSWYIFELANATRRIACLVSIHRTGPRARSIGLGPQILTARDLPAPFSALVPSWLPIISPFRITTDDRPMLLVALYDLTARTQPIVVEHPIDHADFDPATFSARAEHASVTVDSHVEIRVSTPRFSLDVRIQSSKPPIGFGDHGSPTICHGDIETSYIQRPRLAVTGRAIVDGAHLDDLAGEGVHDHQWLNVSVPNLKWIWPHLRLPDGRELTGYVIRDSVGSRHGDADTGRELGRGGWLIEQDGTVRATEFDVRALAHVDTERGRVPTVFDVRFPALDVRFEVAHVVAAPFVRMQTFGALLDAGIYEGPIEVRGHPAIRGWIEVMNAAHVRLDIGNVAVNVRP